MVLRTLMAVALVAAAASAVKNDDDPPVLKTRQDAGSSVAELPSAVEIIAQLKMLGNAVSLSGVPVPTAQQLRLMEMGLATFAHFVDQTCGAPDCGVGPRSQFPDLCERGPSMFNPTYLSTDQCVETAVAMGAGEICLTAHHEGGFALWDTAYSNYSVMHSPYGKDVKAFVKTFSVHEGRRPEDAAALKADDDDSQAWYVNAATGSDANPATASKPVKTITRAQALVRARKDRTRPATVHVAAGWYEQLTTLAFGAADGGDSAQSAITWQGTSNTSVISFGRLVHTTCRQAHDLCWSRKADSATLWELQLPREPGAAPPRQMWNADTNERMIRSRTPNAGSNFLIPLDGALPGAEASLGFKFKHGDLDRFSQEEVPELEVVVYASWSTSRHYIKKLNASAVVFTAPCLTPPTKMWPNSGNRYYVENSLSGVDSAGEFFVSKSGLVTFFPPKSVDPNIVNWVFDRNFKTGMMLRERSAQPPEVLVAAPLKGGGAGLVLPISKMPLDDDFNISLAITAAPKAGGVLLSRGTTTHVRGDVHITIQPGGTIMMDIGWDADLIGKTRVDDGKKHAVAIRSAAGVLSLIIDGKVDASVQKKVSAGSGSAWKLTIAGAQLSAGVTLDSLSYSQLSLHSTQHLAFRDLQLSHAGWGLMRNATADFQSASFLSTAAVECHQCRNVLFHQCSVSHHGGYGLWLTSSSSNSSVVSCDVTDVSGGVRIGQGRPLPDEPIATRTNGIVIKNSRIIGGALVYREAAGVLVQNADDISLLRNEVAYFNHVCISVGWVWGFAPRSGRNQRIIGNLVHHAGNRDLSDLGGVYMLGVQPGSQVSHNVVHSNDPYFLYGHGIYLDEGASGISITQNWVYDTYAASYLQHYGVNNSVTSNVWSNAFGSCLDVSGDFERCSGFLWHPAYRFQQCQYNFTSNIIIATGNSSHHWHQEPEGVCNASYGRNIYFNASKSGLSATFPEGMRADRTYTPPGYPPTGLNLIAANKSLQLWQTAGGDIGSVGDVDPMLKDIANHDFNVAPSSPAIALGFVPADLTKGVGPHCSVQGVVGCPWSMRAPSSRPLKTDDNAVSTSRPLLGVQRWDMYSGDAHLTGKWELGFLPGAQGFRASKEWHFRAPFFCRPQGTLCFDAK